MVETLVVSVDVGVVHMGLAVFVDGTLTEIGCRAVRKPVSVRGVEEVVFDPWPAMTLLLVERQVPRNAAAQKIMHYLEALAHGKGITFHAIDPKARRLLFAEGAKTDTYASRKRAAVEAARPMLLPTPELAETFESLPKKDDVADAILQARAWFVRHPPPTG